LVSAVAENCSQTYTQFVQSVQGCASYATTTAEGIEQAAASDVNNVEQQFRSISLDCSSVCTSSSSSDQKKSKGTTKEVIEVKEVKKTETEVTKKGVEVEKKEVIKEEIIKKK
jgi:hypothetical protein